MMKGVKYLVQSLSETEEQISISNLPNIFIHPFFYAKFF